MKKLQQLMSWGTPGLEGHEEEEKEEVGHRLPPELWLEVFDFLDGKDLTACQLVCKEWYALASRGHRVEEYVAQRKKEKAEKEAQRERERQRRRSERNQQVLSALEDGSKCCAVVSCGCLCCLLLSALCPLCCPCITLFSLRLCRKACCPRNYRRSSIYLE